MVSNLGTCHNTVRMIYRYQLGGSVASLKNSSNECIQYSVKLNECLTHYEHTVHQYEKMFVMYVKTECVKSL